MNLNILLTNNLCYILAQFACVLALICAVFSIQCKDKQKLQILQLFSNLFYGISFILLGGLMGAMIALVAVLRSLIYFELEEHKIYQNIWALIFVYVLYLASFYFVYENWYSFIVLFGALFFSYGTWQKNNIVLRITSITIATINLIYNVMYLSYMGIILESFCICSAIIFFIRIFAESQKNKKVIIKDLTPEKNTLENNNDNKKAN